MKRHETVVVVVAIAIVLAILALRERHKLPPEFPSEFPSYFEIATVGKVDSSRFSMAFPEYGKGLTYIEIGPIVGKYGRIFIAPPEAYDLSWIQLEENIVAGMYRELTPAELEEYWIE